MFFKRKLKKERYSIPEGDFDPVINISYVPQKRLEDIYRGTGGKNTFMTLLPPSSYQRTQGWPEPPFINVCLGRASDTTKNNWLGYINLKYDNQSLNIVNEMGPTDVKGRVVKDGSEYYVSLSLDDSLAEYQEYGDHTEEEKLILDNLIKKIGEDRVEVELEEVENPKNKKNTIFIIKYNGQQIGSFRRAKTSVIQKWAGGRQIGAKMKLRPSNFENHAFSTIYIHLK